MNLVAVSVHWTNVSWWKWWCVAMLSWWLTGAGGNGRTAAGFQLSSTAGHCPKGTSIWAATHQEITNRFVCIYFLSMQLVVIIIIGKFNMVVLSRTTAVQCENVMSDENLSVKFRLSWSVYEHRKTSVIRDAVWRHAAEVMSHGTDCSIEGWMDIPVGWV